MIFRTLITLAIITRIASFVIKVNPPSILRLRMRSYLPKDFFGENNPELPPNNFVKKTDIEVSIQDFLRNIFSDPRVVPHVPHQNFIDISKIDYNVGMIFDRKEDSTNELIGFDMEAAVETIYEVAKKPFDSQTKDLIAAVKGLGGGKTKILTEIRNVLMRKENTLSIAVPLTSDWKFSAMQWEWNRDKAISLDPEVNIILLLIAPMISLIYNVSLNTVFKIMRSSLSLLPASLQSKSMAMQLLRETLKVVVTDVRKYRNVDTVVVILDQASRLVDRAKDSHPHWTDKNRDVLDCVKAALLNSFPEQGDFDFQVALVTASLCVSPIGNSQPVRKVTPLLLPARLDPMTVVNQWWATASNSDAERSRLLPLAVCLNSVPRGLEAAAHFIEKNVGKEINNSYMTDLIEYVIYSTRSRLRLNHRSLSNELVHHIVFNEETTIDAELQTRIVYSFLTNSLKTFQLGETILPETKLFVLGINAQADSSETTDVFHKPFQAVVNLIIKGKDFKKEDYFFMWLKIRLYVAHACRKEVGGLLKPFIGLGDFLGFHPGAINAFPKYISNMLEEKIGDYYLAHQYLYACKRLKYSSYANEVEFCKAIKQLKDVHDAKIRLSVDENDAFDGLFKYHSKIRQHDVAVFWNSMKTTSTATVAGEGSQGGALTEYRHIKRLMAAHDQPFLYIYVTADPGPSSFPGGDNDCLILRGDQSRVFFGLHWEMIQYSSTL